VVYYLLWALVAHGLLALLAVAAVLRSRKEPMGMLTWIFAIVTLPFVGSVLYWAMESTRIHRKAGRRRHRVAHLMSILNRRAIDRAKAPDDGHVPDLPEDLRTVEHMGQRLAQMPATSGNAVCVYQEASATYAALEEAIRAAERHIHLEYYIWQADDTGHHFRDLLIEKARQGVECRLLLDAVGCWWLTRRFLRPLTEAGCQVAFFMPLYPSRRRRLSLHLRNHRKIAVIDGRVAFAGSQNVGDEYLGRLKKLCPWYDTHMRVAGPAVLFLQQTFAEDWFLAHRESLTAEAYFPSPQCVGESIVQVLPTGPERDISPLDQLIFAAVSGANSSIRIETPYFVPGPPLRMALVHACYRGVRVQLVLPTRSNHLLVLWAGRSFYSELLDAGVEIYEYDAGMLHSKIMTVDDRWCMLGTANMDVRSFRLNFEVTALLYDRGVTRELAESIERHCGQARRISLRDVWQRGLRAQLAEGVARLFTPLL
jgi:cardiolipin synthase